MAIWSRWTLGASGAAALFSTWRAYDSAPSRVPLHYGASGMPDRWGAPLELLLVHGGIVVATTALFFALPELVRRGPRSIINLPNKDYWLTPEHRPVAATKLASWSAVLGTAVNLLLLSLQQLLPPRFDGSPLPTHLPLLATGAFALFVLGWCVVLLRSYRLPQS